MAQWAQMKGYCGVARTFGRACPIPRGTAAATCRFTRGGLPHPSIEMESISQFTSGLIDTVAVTIGAPLSCVSARKNANGAAADNSKGVAVLMDHEPLPGQDKWLGGVLGADGCVYGVPGHARQVLKLEPNTGTVTTIGGPFNGKYKWLRGVAAADGAIYCIPCHAETVLRIDCTTSESVCTEVGGPLPGDWKWHGGVLSPHDGCIYGIPQFAEHSKDRPCKSGGLDIRWAIPWCNRR